MQLLTQPKNNVSAPGPAEGSGWRGFVSGERRSLYVTGTMLFIDGRITLYSSFLRRAKH
jgi:hypothetical protein